MSEPKAVAETLEEVVPGVWRWHVLDERIDAGSDAHAVSDAAGTVLIDPLPLREAALKSLEPIAAICLTAACHQRSAWPYRRAHGANVYAPEGWRRPLPGALTAIHTPGPENAHYAFWRERSPSVLFCPDLIMRAPDGALAFIPANYHDDPEATRDSVRRPLDLPFEVLCLDHGAPITADPHAALRTLRVAWRT